MKKLKFKIIESSKLLKNDSLDNYMMNNVKGGIGPVDCFIYHEDCITYIVSAQ